MEDMRLALTEQEETQEQMEQVLEEKMALLQELSAEVNRLKEKVLQQNQGAGGPSEDLDLAKDEASRAQESLKILTEKSQAERRRWQEEKLSLIGQAKEAEDKRNQEMRKFAEDRERYCRQQSLLESKLLEKEAAMESWRKERDALVAALEVQLQKLLSSQAEKDKVIKELSEQSSKQPAEFQLLLQSGGNPEPLAVDRTCESTQCSCCEHLDLVSAEPGASEAALQGKRCVQEEVGTENRRNTRTKLTPKKAESSSSGCRFDSQSSRKDGTLQKIGDFLQSSPTLLGSKAKKMMSLVSGRLDPDSAAASSSLSLRAKRGRKKLYRPEISCPMDMPPHPVRALNRQPQQAAGEPAEPRPQSTRPVLLDLLVHHQFFFPPLVDLLRVQTCSLTDHQLN
ncbi:kinesin-like protein KIF20B [Fundulus heteroclitus]|uniref:kinesin-like protein KIF20B n=1 Tax=Fundulus heteroclitus TaxID=8078 RepID=UPI00165B2640|nr:kinesin-like protein KIF20B [Fundulus heteroclitus]